MLGGVNNTVLDIFGHNMNVCSGNQGVDSTLRLVTAYCNQQTAITMENFYIQSTNAAKDGWFIWSQQGLKI